uniref:C-type lectin domain-containing protein n=1 Tax=Salmo trutta TaxID=8032 RepID=A0A674BC90_SALTR
VEYNTSTITLYSILCLKCLCPSSGTVCTLERTWRQFTTPRSIIFCRSWLGSHTNGFPGTWIGGSDAVYNTIWLWSDGSRFDYHGWNPGEPSNNNRERCLEMNFGVHKRWNNKPCHYTLPSICSKRLC